MPSPPLQSTMRHHLRRGHKMRNRLIILMMLVTLNCAAHAQDELGGRLFTTAAERARLDQIHRQNPTLSTALSSTTSAPASEPEQATLNGYVTRSSGKNTTWINQVAHEENEYSGRVHISQKPGHKAEISMKAAGGRRVNVKVGDTLDLQTGTLHRIDEPTETPPAPASLH